MTFKRARAPAPRPVPLSGEEQTRLSEFPAVRAELAAQAVQMKPRALKVKQYSTNTFFVSPETASGRFVEDALVEAIWMMTDDCIVVCGNTRTATEEWLRDLCCNCDTYIITGVCEHTIIIKKEYYFTCADCSNEIRTQRAIIIETQSGDAFVNLEGCRICRECNYNYAACSRCNVRGRSSSNSRYVICEDDHNIYCPTCAAAQLQPCRVCNRGHLLRTRLDERDLPCRACAACGVTQTDAEGVQGLNGRRIAESNYSAENI